MFIIELGKKNFDLNLLAVFTNLKVHLDNVNYFP